MQKKYYLIWIYATLVLIGGVVGYRVAHSLPSLIASSCIASLLAVCGYGLKKGYVTAYYATMGILCAVLAFFGYRFSLNFQIAPAGVMLLLTGGLLVYLATTKDLLKQEL